MTIEQYIVRELKEDIKLLISKVTELEKKIEHIHPALQDNKVKVETLESQAEELGASMDASDYGTMITREMEKIRKEGKIKENSVTDTHKVIYEAEKRVAKMSTKDIYKYDKK